MEPRLALAASLTDWLATQNEILPGPQPLISLLSETKPVNNPDAHKVTREIVPGEIIIAVPGEPGLDAIREQLRHSLELAQVDLGGQVSVQPLMTFQTEAEETQSLVVLQLGEFQDVPAAGLILGQLPGIDWAQPNYAYRGEVQKLTPNDPSYPSQFHHTRMQNNLAWDTTQGLGVVVAVTDDGMQLNHPDLLTNLWVNTDEIAGNGVDDDANGYIDDRNGWDFVTNDGNPSPINASNDHGTHVAGIIAARTNNAIGVAGTAGQAQVMPIRWYGDDGGFTSTIIANSFRYATDNGAKIVNSSYEADHFSTDSVIMAGFQYMYNGNVLHFNAGDNEAIRDSMNQAIHQTLLVASSDSTDTLSSFSNFGIGTDLTSPGDGILSTITGSSYASYGGTSMAAPNAAAVAALIWSAYPSYTRDQVAARLIGTVSNINAQNPGYIGQLGGGRVNSFSAVPSAALPTLAAPKINRLREVPTTANPTIFPISRIRVALTNILDRTTVETAANWSLVSAGVDATLGTADDVPVTLTRTRPYLVGSNDVFFTFPTLAAGSYRFTAVSGGLRDPFNTALDGDASGTAGGNFVKDFQVISGTVAFEGDFSGTTGAPNNEGFTTTGPWHLSTGRGANPGHSIDDSYYVGAGEGPSGGGSYANNVTATLTSPLINLAGVNGVIALEFNHFLASEPPYDFAYVQVIDGASTIEIAKSGSSLAHTQVGFEPVSLDLSAFAGKSIRVRFRFTSDSSETAEGWYVDDVVVRYANYPSAGGQVWNDANGNLIRDVSDNGLAGWTVYLDGNNSGTLDSPAVTRPSTDVPKPIPDGNPTIGTTKSSIFVGGLGNLTDVNVTVNISHTYVSDVDIFLISPAGTRIELAADIGFDGNNFTNTVFDQQAATLITSGSAPYTGTFRPEGNLSLLNGTAGNGLWQLEVSDDAAADEGVINSWSLQLTAPEQSVVTPATGDYLFSNLPPAGYVIRQVVQPTWTQVLPLSVSHTPALAIGQALTGLDFANSQGNTAPTISNLPDQTIAEDANAIVNFTIDDLQTAANLLVLTPATTNPTLLPLGNIVIAGTGANRTVTLTPVANQFGTATVTITVTDVGGLTAQDTLVLTVNPINDAPSFVKGADQSVAMNAGPQIVAGWATAISAGPNEATQTVNVNVTQNSNSALFSVLPLVAADGTLTYTPAIGATGTATITLVAQDNGGTAGGGVDASATQSFTITVNAPATFQVTSYTPTATGVILNLSRDLDPSQLNLFDLEGGTLGPADVTLVGLIGGNIRGSVVVAPNLRQLTFIRTSGVLPSDLYTVTLRSAADGFLDTTAALLDGDANGTAGGNYVQTFSIGTPPLDEVTVSLPNVARGPLQPVHFPANTTSGLPITLSDGEGITSATLHLNYDPALLTITGGALPAGLPVGANVNVNVSTPGLAIVTFTSPTPLLDGPTELVRLQATVPETAPYRNKHVLDISNVELNAGDIPALADDALHVVAYFGDTTGSGTYTAQDASRLSRLAIGIESALPTYLLLDPVVIADVATNGLLSSADTARVLQLAIGIVVPEVPLLPNPAASFVQGGPDPKLSIPTDLVATPGANLTIPVHIDSIVDLTGNGLESADLIIYYDAEALDVTSASLGSLLTNARGNWFIAANIDPSAGRIIVSLGGNTPLEGFFIGELVQLTARVKDDARPGSVAINLAATSRSPGQFTQLNEGYLTLIPAPTDAANDPVDGLLTILPGVDHAPSQFDRTARDIALMQFVTDWSARTLTPAKAEAFLAAVRGKRR